VAAARMYIEANERTIADCAGKTDAYYVGKSTEARALIEEYRAVVNAGKEEVCR
jgi:hypothetical protein